VLRRIFGPKRDGVTRGLIKMRMGDEKCRQNFGWKAGREETVGRSRRR
jgi:hypothetical protein